MSSSDSIGTNPASPPTGSGSEQDGTSFGSRGQTLRERAELCHASRTQKRSEPIDPLDARRLLQELEIHQIELEMQNLELQQARSAAEKAHRFYRDLYDFAPVGYFTLSPGGEVRMVNLAGAFLLGVEREVLTGQAFAQWIDPDRRSDFLTFFARVLNDHDLLSIETEVVRSEGHRFSVGIEARKDCEVGGCRLTVTDVTRRKAEEKAEWMLNASAVSNRNLQAEALHWRQMDMCLETTRRELNTSIGQPAEGKLSNLYHVLLGAQEEERKRISSELRDRIGQSMEAIQLELDQLVRDREAKAAVPGNGGATHSTT